MGFIVVFWILLFLGVKWNELSKEQAGVFAVVWLTTVLAVWLGHYNSLWVVGVTGVLDIVLIMVVIKLNPKWPPRP